jgi:hypothetical protein
VNQALSSGFERLLGKRASEDEIRRLYEVRDALGLDDNDALWLVLCALEHYDTLYRAHPERIAEATKRALDDVQQAAAKAASIEAKRTQRKLADVVAAAGLAIAEKRTEVARVQGFAVAVAAMVAFGSLCLSIGYALGNARVPPWTQGSGARRIIGAALGAPAGWVLLLLLLPVAAYSARSGWVAARTPGATTGEVMKGWARVLLSFAAAAAVATLMVRLL